MPAPKIFAAATLAGALLLSAVPAFAADRSVMVRYGDLDLTTDAGAATLQTRVASAVKQVCGSADIRDLPAMQDMRSCREEARSRSTRDVALAMENARNGRRLASNAGLTIGH